VLCPRSQVPAAGGAQRTTRRRRRSCMPCCVRMPHAGVKMIPRRQNTIPHFHCASHAAPRDPRYLVTNQSVGVGKNLKIVSPSIGHPQIDASGREMRAVGLLRALRALPWGTGGGTRRRLALGAAGAVASVGASFTRRRLALGGGGIASVAFAVGHSSSDCQGGRPPYFQPAQPYPEWDLDWDCRAPPLGQDRTQPSGPVRHIILVRHGQYDEREREDAQRMLTPLGREQAAVTGERLAAIAASTKGRVRIHTSTMTRSRQTAEIIREKMGAGALHPCHEGARFRHRLSVASALLLSLLLCPPPPLAVQSRARQTCLCCQRMRPDPRLVLPSH
jgi:hypothetical protein